MKMVVLLSLILGSIQPGVGAKESTNAPLENLTLERAIEIALNAHPHLAEAAANIESAHARAAGAGKLPNPEIVTRIESAPLAGGAISEAEYVAGVSQKLPIGKRLAAAKAVGTAEIELSQSKFALEALNIRRAVENAFATALYAAEAANIQTNIAASMRELVRVLKLRVDHGDAARSDVRRASAEEAQDRLQANEANHLHQQALRALAAALGDHSLPVRSLVGKLEDTFQVESIARWLTNISEHPTIATAADAVRFEEARLRLARAEMVPDVNLDLFYRRLQADRENAFDIGVSVALPVFDRKSRLREAESNLAASKARQARMRNEIGYDLHKHEVALQQQLEIVTVFREDVLPNLDNAVAAAQARFSAGDISLTEMVALKRDYAAARMEYLDALRRVMEAWSALRR
jgi:cobalt-zinc-cadmium efflux system outer membrane protein